MKREAEVNRTSPLFRLRHVDSWERVRPLGESRLVGRASAITILVVPALAAAWPAVASTIAEWNGHCALGVPCTE